MKRPGLVSRGPGHPHSDLGGRVVPVTQLLGCDEAVCADRDRRSRGVIGDEHGPRVQLLHVRESFDHAGFGVPGGIRWPRLTPVESVLELVQHLRFFVEVRDDEARVIGAGRVELHTEELDEGRDHPAGQLKLRVGPLQADSAVVRSSMVSRDRPVEAVPPCHQGIQGNRVDRLSRDHRSRRVGGNVPSDAESTVDVVIPGEPPGLSGRLSLGRDGRRHEKEGDRSPAEPDRVEVR